MSDFAKYLETIAEELKILEGDIQNIIDSKSDGSTKGGRKSIQPMTRMYRDKNDAESISKGKVNNRSLQSVTKISKNKSEVENSSQDIEFIKDRINRIFSR